MGLSFSPVQADPGDVESSHDYVGFPRPLGFIISDYDEDNPAEFDFPVAHPLPDDAAHVETVHVKGHRYVIRYELAAGQRVPSLFQTQQFYEKLASDGGYKVMKGGAVGDVTETFYKGTAAHEIWVYLDPAVSANVLTVMESNGAPTASPAPRLSATPHSATLSSLAPPPEPPQGAPAQAPALAPEVTPVVPPPPVDPNGDAIFTQLTISGRVVVPFTFQPGKDALDPSSQPVVDRVVAMMKKHPDLFLRIEGHTDNSGDPEDNMRLSAGRAYAVQAALIDASIEKNRLDSVGVGGLQPLASNNTADGREKNRRIELVMWKKYPASHPADNAPSMPTPTRAGL